MGRGVYRVVEGCTVLGVGWGGYGVVVGCRVWGVGCTFLLLEGCSSPPPPVPKPKRFRAQGSGFRVEGMRYRVCGSTMRVSGSGCKRFRGGLVFKAHRRVYQLKRVAIVPPARSQNGRST